MTSREERKLPEELKGRVRTGENNTTVQGAFSFYPGDKEILDALVEHLGSNKSDVVRTAIRHLAAHLGVQPFKKPSK